MPVLFKEDLFTKVTAIHFGSGGAAFLVRAANDPSVSPAENFTGTFQVLYSSHPTILRPGTQLLNAPNSLPKDSTPTSSISLDTKPNAQMKSDLYTWRYPQETVTDADGVKYWQTLMLWNFGKIKAKLTPNDTRLDFSIQFTWTGLPTRIITNRFTLSVATFASITDTNPKSKTAERGVLDFVTGTEPPPEADSRSGWSPNLGTTGEASPTAQQVMVKFPLHVTIDTKSLDVRIG